ncbi:MAG TPA: hypothetical protein VK486_09205 [Thermoleophilaceae bacterium]|nr:hypothetical protein [Thermoleophilaceae bacterium]
MEPPASDADWITAIATGAAAIGTVGALLFSAAAAKAASMSAQAASAGLDAQARPLLLDVPRENYTDFEHEYPWPDEGTRRTGVRGEITFDAQYGTFAIPVRNVGHGVARIEHCELVLHSGEAHRQHGGEALPAGEDLWLAGKPVAGEPFARALAHTPSPLHEAAPLVFSVVYADISGSQRQRLELALGGRGRDSAWRVLQTAHTTLDDA